MKNIFVLVMTLVFGSTAFAEADLNPNIFNQQATSATRESGGTSSGSTGTGSSIPVMKSTINPGSQQGQASQSGGAGTNAAVGQALMSAGAALMANPPTVPAGAALMAMGLLAMMQSGEDSGAAGQSAATGSASNTNGTSTGTAAVDGTGTSGFTEAKIKEGQAKLAAAGYKMTAAGITNPDGSFTSSSAFNSPSAMAAAGISPAAIAEAQKILGDINTSGARVSSVGVNSGGGGGGITEGDSHGSSDAAMGAGNPFNIDADKKGSLVAGKTVMFDGEPIGVRGQNIFEMVHSCYQKKRDGKHFIESEVDIATRSPASVKPSKK